MPHIIARMIKISNIFQESSLTFYVNSAIVQSIHYAKEEIMMEFNEEFNNGDVMAANPNSFTESFPIADQNTVLKRVFKWMALGLTISAVSAFAGLFGIVYMVSAGLGNIAEILM